MFYTQLIRKSCSSTLQDFINKVIDSPISLYFWRQKQKCFSKGLFVFIIWLSCHKHDSTICIYLSSKAIMFLNCNSGYIKFNGCSYIYIWRKFAYCVLYIIQMNLLEDLFASNVLLKLPYRRIISRYYRQMCFANTKELALFYWIL